MSATSRGQLKGRPRGGGCLHPPRRQRGHRLLPIKGVGFRTLDTLFLTMPVSWRRTVVQYTGRFASRASRQGRRPHIRLCRPARSRTRPHVRAAAGGLPIDRLRTRRRSRSLNAAAAVRSRCTSTTVGFASSPPNCPTAPTHGFPRPTLIAPNTLRRSTRRTTGTGGCTPAPPSTVVHSGLNRTGFSGGSISWETGAHGKTEQILTRGSRARGPVGVRARRSARLAVGRDPVRRREDRVFIGNAPALGPASGTGSGPPPGVDDRRAGAVG